MKQDPHISACVKRRRSSGSSDLCDHQRPVIGERSALREPSPLPQNQVGNFRRGGLVMLLDQRSQPRGAEKLAFAVRRLRDSVRMKDKNVSRLEPNPPFVIGHFLEYPPRKARQFHLAAPATLVH